MQSQSNRRIQFVLIWLVVASGLAVVLSDQLDSAFSYQITVFSRTFFWISAVAYFSFRIFCRISRKS
jgi:hypothetical protein